MGCAHSISTETNRISVKSAQSDVSEAVISAKGDKVSNMGSSVSKRSDVNSATRNDIPSSMDDIPVCDLGESLDTRRAKPSKPFTAPFNSAPLPTIKPHGSAKSEDSSDSGIYELDEDYSFVITEASSPELVAKVESEFKPIEDLDLTITGQACPRLLTANQKMRKQEEEILENLRQEGFISTSRERSAGGLSFEIVETTAAASAGSGKLKPKDFLPEGHRKVLDAHRPQTGIRTQEEVKKKQEEARERRKAELEMKVGKALEHSGRDKFDKKIEAMKEKKDRKCDAAMEKREAHLRDLRDKLKEKNQKTKQIKLKKTMTGPFPVPITSGYNTTDYYEDKNDDDFFS